MKKFSKNLMGWILLGFFIINSNIQINLLNTNFGEPAKFLEIQPDAALYDYSNIIFRKQFTFDADVELAEYDFDGDNINEFVIFHGNDVFLYEWNGSGFSQFDTYSVSGFQMHSLDIGDVNGDGLGEIVVSNWYNTDNGYESLNHAYLHVSTIDSEKSRTLLWYGQVTSGTAGEMQIRIGDIDGDGDCEVGYNTQVDSTGSYGILNWTGSAMVDIMHGTTSWHYCDSVGVGDLDNDGRDEFTFGYGYSGSKNGDVDTYDYNPSTQLITKRWTVNVGRDPRFPFHFVDLDGDNIDEIVTHAGVAYDYKARAFNINGDTISQQGSDFSATGDNGKNFAAGFFDDSGQIKLWTRESAILYKLYYFNGANYVTDSTTFDFSGYSHINTLTGFDLDHDGRSEVAFTGTVSGQIGYVEIRGPALNIQGASYPPNAPVLPVINPNPSNTGEIQLDWNPIDGATNYLIYRSNNPIYDVSGMNEIWSTTDSSYVDYLIIDGTYYYVVTAYNASGESDISECQSVQVNIPPPTPDAPQVSVLSENPTTKNYAKIGWSPVSNAQTYKVYRSTSEIISLSGLVPKYNLPATQLQITDYQLNPNNNYYYVVTALNASGESDPSNCVAVYLNMANELEKLNDFVKDMDPLVREIVLDGLSEISKISGVNLEDYLSSHGNVLSISRELDLSSNTQQLGFGLKLTFTLTASFSSGSDEISFLFSCNSQISADSDQIKEIIKFSGIFKTVGNILSVIKLDEIDVNLDLNANIECAFTLNLNTKTFSIDAICLRITPSITLTAQLLPLLVKALKPELYPLLKTTRDMINYLGYDIFEISTAQLVLMLEIYAKYTVSTQLFELSAILSLDTSIILDIIKTSNPHINEIEFGIHGAIGVEFDSNQNSIQFGGELYLYFQINTANLGIFLEPFIESALNYVGLTANQQYTYYIFDGLADISSIGPCAASLLPDNDSDGLDNDLELLLGTDPNYPDSDFDGIFDGDEYNVGSDPLLNDSDSDQISDYDEYYYLSTNLTSSDTDGDGLSDFYENQTSLTNPINPDSDFDGLLDGDEINLYSSNPLLNDTDGDGILDGIEALWYETDYLNDLSKPMDSDSDGIFDKDEISIFKSSPYRNDFTDSDSDMLMDLLEIAIGTDYLNPDSDNDGLSDGLEYNTYNTDPLDEDTDGDSYSDGLEVEYGSDPLDPNSTPNIPSSEQPAPFDLEPFLPYILIGSACAILVFIANLIFKKKKSNGNENESNNNEVMFKF